MCACLHAGTDPDRDFSGNWQLDLAASDTASLGTIDPVLTVSQSGTAIQCSAGGAQWTYPLDGSEARNHVGAETRNSATKWEGASLLINTLVSGNKSYTVMDRWRLSRDHNTLTIKRQVAHGFSQSEGSLVYRREGTSGPGWRPAGEPADTAAPRPLTERPKPGVAPDVTVFSGTRVLLTLINELNTKHAHDGDRVYLRTAVPVAANGRVVIPRGSDVAGTITHTKPAGKVSGKGELYIRFDSLTLPNGVSRDFHARPSGEEGKVQGDTRAADGRTVMAGAGMGATVGAITHGLSGAAAGGAVGALAGVLLSRQQNVILRPGTHVEMVLDRDLVFHPDELSRVH